MKTVIKLKVLVFIFCVNPFAGIAQTWTSMGNCISGVGGIDALEVYKNKLYISGGYSMTCYGIVESGMSVFDGQKLDSLPGDHDGIYCFTQYQDTLILGGQFPYLGVNPWPSQPTTRYLGKWDEVNWHPANFYSNFGARVNALAVYNGELYVGGNFTQIGSVFYNRIAKWTGSQWQDVGGGFTGNCVVECMTIYNGELYVGGHVGLPGSGNNYYYNCVKWNGTQWDSVGGKFGPNWVTSMCVDSISNKLYIGGGLQYVDTVSVYSIAMWDGASISSPGGLGITEGALGMGMYNNELYVGGTGWSDTVLAKYDGASWSRIPVSKNSFISAFKTYNGNLYVGGVFDSINGIPSKNIICYGPTCPQGVGVQEVQQQLKFKIFPNPAKDRISIEIDEDQMQDFGLTVYNSLGKQILKKRIDRQYDISTSDYSSGIYYFRICNETGKICHTEKIIIE